jgi:ferrochelatase
MQEFDALLLLSFGGPEGPEEVLPFLANVLRGKNVPPERMLAVAEHYQHFGGVSPINAQCRELLANIRREFDERGPHLPVYWGNRNWHPLLSDTLQQMAADGVRHALAFVTSAYSSYSGCRQYLEDIERARAAVGPEAPEVWKLRPFFNHPGFVAAAADHARQALSQIPVERHGRTQVAYTAHSIPLAMAQGCDYELQLRDVAAQVNAELGELPSRLVFQSRSGPPTQPWLEPDIADYLREIHAVGNTSDVLVVPIGFTSDHMEVLYDLDTEAQQLCCELGLNMVRARTAGSHPRFVSMIRDLVLERTTGAEVQCTGSLGPRPERCRPECCPSGRPPRPA